MRALTWQGPNSLQVDTVPDPVLLNPQDVIIKVTLSSVCGSDLHLLGGYVPTMHPGDILGHEFLGEVVEVGAHVKTVVKGDRVITVSIIGCGECEHCVRQDFSCCDNSNPNPCVTETAYGQPCGGIIGYSHAFGGYAGSHATYIRVPYADTNLFKVPDGVTDEQAVFVSDAAPTGYFAADNAGIQPGDTVAVWGCGAVGQMAIASAYLLGAERVIAIDRLADRLALAESKGGAITLDYETTNIHQALLELTGGRGPDRCIDCVGMEAHGTEIDYAYDKAKQLMRLHTERGTVLRQAIRACRKGGTVSVVGVYGGLMDKFPMGAVMNKALTLRSGQQPGQRYANQLFTHIQEGRLDPSWMLTHPMDLEDSAQGYALFKEKGDQCLRAVFRP
ncbi:MULTISPECIES: zinc-dependent alcohol dehydrogenase [Pseudomonas]|uniref:Glutathione-dependent formaldehyde dehydrogenase n=1 Tax=Pseudomonas quercus TaxID=2722792 RepID=A0ABX0YCB1_9PSED|nr:MULTISPECIES: zinc-dependent alcohol dehydrogenase [Pseudomonas]MBF7142468.1 glutathione-dependent formaldehyde dehydrogenase [Pseudomonas sp. LY10J]NJP01006.1 glutathione-dependent formaldehyde dehydrogenase [Pseudomonas quercus]